MSNLSLQALGANFKLQTYAHFYILKRNACKIGEKLGTEAKVVSQVFLVLRPSSGKRKVISLLQHFLEPLN